MQLLHALGIPWGRVMDEAALIEAMKARRHCGDPRLLGDLRPSPGSRFAGSLTASGQRLAEVLVTLKEPVTDLSLLKQRPIVNLLHSPRLAADKQDKPAIQELVENVLHDLKIEEAWIGEGSLTFRSAGAKNCRTWRPSPAVGA